MTRTKKCTPILLCLILCLSLFTAPAASAAETEMGGEIMPCMEYIARAGHDFYIKDGTAYVYAYVDCYEDLATACQVSVQLQKRSLLFFWDPVETWTNYEGGSFADLDVSKSVSSGTYRVVTTFTAWSGDLSEVQKLTSDNVTA